MPYRLDWEPRGVYKKLWGFVTAAEYLQSMRDIHGDARFDGLRYAINDFLAVEGFDVGDRTIVDMAAASLGAKHSNSRIHVALVTHDERIRALAGLFASRDLRSFPTRVFATVGEARRWLESPDADAADGAERTEISRCLRCRQVVPVDDDGFCDPCLKAMEQACL